MESLLINAPALWFLALTGVILVLYLLRLKRRRYEVSSILLFSRSVEEVQANAPLQWLKKNLLLLLQLIVLILLVLALARPFVNIHASKVGKTIILIDTSYSMMAHDNGKTRLDIAVSKARKVLASLRQSDMTMIIAMNTSPHVLNGFTPDKMELNRSLNKLSNYLGGSANLNEAMKLLNPLLKGSARIVLISDGGFTNDAVESIHPDSEFTFLSVGSEIDNVGITSLSINEIPGTDSYELFTVINNNTEKNVSRTLRLSSKESILDQRKLEIPPDKGVDVVISPLIHYSGTLKLELVEKDGFEVDDSCDVIMPDQRIIPVSFVSEPDVLFESALAGDSGLDVVRIPPASAESMNLSARNGIFIFNKCVPPKGVNIPMLVIAPKVNIGGVTIGQSSEGPRVVDWDSTHPLLAFINVTDLRIAAAIRSRISSDMKVVIDGTDGPLLVAGEESYLRYAVLLFDVEQSDFPLRAAFPIFLHNTAVWLSRTANVFDPYNTSVGRQWKYKVSEDVKRVKLISPSGRESILVVRGKEVGGFSLDEIGIWHIDNEKSKKPISVNLLDAKESQLRVANSFRIGNTEVKSNVRGIVNREIYSWILLVALFVIIGEWFIYHQRNV